MKTYLVEVTRWEAQRVTMEVDAENAMQAKNIGLKNVREGNFEQAEIDSTIPVKVNLFGVRRLRR